MRKTNSLLLVMLSVAGLSACDVDQTREAKAPDIDVKAEGGQLPAYDVDGPNVDVKTEERTVTVPDVDVDVKKEEKTVTVPDVDVQPPPED